MRKVTAYYSFVILIILLTARLTIYAYRMHEIRCHKYIISFYIAIFNPTKKVSNRFNLSLNEKMKLWRLHSRHHLGKTNRGKGDILGLKNDKIVYY